MDSKRTTLTMQLRDGQLEHVVHVAGEAVQAHTSRAAAMCALMLALACAGCESTKRLCDEHPIACPMIVGALGTSALMCIPGHSSSRSIGTQPVPEIPTPSVSCANPETCR